MDFKLFVTAHEQDLEAEPESNTSPKIPFFRASSPFGNSEVPPKGPQIRSILLDFCGFLALTSVASRLKMPTVAALASLVIV